LNYNFVAELGVTYALHLELGGKRIVDFLFTIIEFFPYLLRLKRYKQILVEIGTFQRGWFTFRRRPSTTVSVSV